MTYMFRKTSECKKTDCLAVNFIILISCFDQYCIKIIKSEKHGSDTCNVYFFSSYSIVHMAYAMFHVYLECFKIGFKCIPTSFLNASKQNFTAYFILSGYNLKLLT